MGESLGAVRFGGYDLATSDAKAHVFDLNGEWEEKSICFVAEDGHFNQSQATAITITPELQSLRRQSAQDIRVQARAQHPAPPRPGAAVGGNAEQHDWQSGVSLPTCVKTNCVVGQALAIVSC